MSEPASPPPSAPSIWATHVLIPIPWTPEQVLAVLEPLDELRETVVSLCAGQVQDLLREQQRVDHAAAGDDHSSGDGSF
ncbi:MAG TPA: hypothetical protein VLJ14_19410 [Ktedonobacterales bacterium]|nr:hypothetical protein [Ktedonobacterales bacterium]